MARDAGRASGAGGRRGDAARVFVETGDTAGLARRIGPPRRAGGWRVGGRRTASDLAALPRQQAPPAAVFHPDLQQAAEALRQAIESSPGSRRGTAFLAAAEALAGNIAQAQQHMAEFRRTDPGMTISRFVADRSSVPLSATSPTFIQENERVLDGLRRAGMPEG